MQSERASEEEECARSSPVDRWKDGSADRVMGVSGGGRSPLMRSHWLRRSTARGRENVRFMGDGRMARSLAGGVKLVEQI